MKRSEMLEIIDRTYEEFIDSWLKEGTKAIAQFAEGEEVEFSPLNERILQAFEKAGMLPPAKRLDIASGKILHYEIPDSIEKTDKLSEIGELTNWIIEDTTVLWEPEDV